MLVEPTNFTDPDSYMLGVNREAYYHHHCDRVPDEYFYRVVREVLDEVETEIEHRPFSESLIYAAKEKASAEIIARLQRNGYEVYC
ncbi:MAG: hypothetical protein ABEJ25_06645 [Candidatus Bipolaricaulia bacterium]